MEFEFDKIADYYAHSDKETQNAFEELILVIIDIEDSIKRGILSIKTGIEEMIDEKLNQ